MNGRFFRRVAAQMILQLRHFLCCVRARHENRIHRLGSELPFAAMTSNGGYGPEADIMLRPTNGIKVRGPLAHWLSSHSYGSEYYPCNALTPTSPSPRAFIAKAAACDPAAVV